MFITKVSFLMDLLKEYKPELAEGLTRVAAVWDVDEVQRNKVLEEVWPGLENSHRPRCRGAGSDGRASRCCVSDVLYVQRAYPRTLLDSAN